ATVHGFADRLARERDLPATESERVERIVDRALEGAIDRLGQLLALPGARLHQRGDDEATAVFPPDRLEEAASILRLMRRRQLSETHRRKLVEASASFRFPPGSNVPQRARETIPTAPDVPEAVDPILGCFGDIKHGDR